MPAQPEGAQLRPVEQGSDTCRCKLGTKIRGEIACSKAVDRQANQHAACRCPAERCTDCMTDAVICVDVTFEKDLAFGRIEVAQLSGIPSF